MKIIDLFCGAGGASMGIHRVFPEAEIVGYDLVAQRHYPFTFIQGDALKVDLSGADFVWASPPCQHYSAITIVTGKRSDHPDLVDPIRQKLLAWGGPFVIENVVGAPLRNPFTLCGSMFGLRIKAGNQLRRHRLFEAPWFHGIVPLCQHNGLQSVGVHGHAGGTSKRDGAFFNTQEWREAMGIDWMTGKELAEAIPPAYSEWILNRWREINELQRTIPKMGARMGSERNTAEP